MADDDVKADDLPQVELVFIGQNSNGKGWTWRDGQKLRVYGSPKMRGRVPGGIYSIRADRSEDGLTVFPHTLTYTGRRSEDAAVLQLREDEAEQERRVQRLHTGTSKTQDIDDALAPLLELAKSMNHPDRRTLAAFVAAKIHAAR